MLRHLARSSEQSGLALVLEPEALAVDADDGGVVEDAIEHRGGKHTVAGKGAMELGYSEPEPIAK